MWLAPKEHQLPEPLRGVQHRLPFPRLRWVRVSLIAGAVELAIRGGEYGSGLMACVGSHFMPRIRVQLRFIVEYAGWWGGKSAVHNATVA